MKHYYDTEIAKDVGVIAAAIFEHIRYWVEQNQTSGVNFEDDRYWMYSTIADFQEYFDYLTADQIRRALERLEDKRLITTGNYNKKSFDRTRWFTTDIYGDSSHLANLPNRSGKNAKSKWQKNQMEVAKMPNPFGKNHKPIPNIETNIETNIEEDNKPLTPLQVEEKFRNSEIVKKHPELFEVFKDYALHRKAMKAPLKTSKAINLNINKAVELSGGDPEKIRLIVEQSIREGWKGMFPLHDREQSKPKDKPKSGNQFTQLIAEEGLDDVDITDLGIDDEEEGGLFE